MRGKLILAAIWAISGVAMSRGILQDWYQSKPIIDGMCVSAGDEAFSLIAGVALGPVFNLAGYTTIERWSDSYPRLIFDKTKMPGCEEYKP